MDREESAGAGYPSSPKSPLKSLVMRKYREALARSGGGAPRATVRKLEVAPRAASPSRKGRSMFNSEEIGRRSLSQHDISRNSARALNWFRDSRRQNVDARSMPDMETLPTRHASPPKRQATAGLAKLRAVVTASQAAKHIMHSGVQVGGGSGLASRLRAKQLQQQQI